jgi:hypothetical protein
VPVKNFSFYNQTNKPTNRQLTNKPISKKAKKQKSKKAKKQTDLPVRRHDAAKGGLFVGLTE